MSKSESETAADALAYFERMEVEPDAYSVASWAREKFTSDDLDPGDDYYTTKYLCRLISALILIKGGKNG